MYRLDCSTPSLSSHNDTSVLGESNTSCTLLPECNVGLQSLRGSLRNVTFRESTISLVRTGSAVREAIRESRDADMLLLMNLFIIFIFHFTIDLRSVVTIIVNSAMTKL